MTYRQELKYMCELPEVKAAQKVLNIIHCTWPIMQAVTRNRAAQIRITGLTAIAQAEVVELCKDALHYEDNVSSILTEETDRADLENFIETYDN